MSYFDVIGYRSDHLQICCVVVVAVVFVVVFVGVVVVVVDDVMKPTVVVQLSGGLCFVGPLLGLSRAYYHVIVVSRV